MSRLVPGFALIVLVDALMQQRPREELQLTLTAPITFDPPRLPRETERLANPSAPIPERIRRQARSRR